MFNALAHKGSKMTKLYTFICVGCDGDSLVYELPTRWSVKEQNWVLSDDAVGDAVWCDDCGDYSQIKKVEWHPVLPEEVTK